MLTAKDRLILRAALLDGRRTLADVKAIGWGEGALAKLTECRKRGYADRAPPSSFPFDQNKLEWFLTEPGKGWVEQPEPGVSNDRFLRHGGWCECERSCNTATRGFEPGVSVYECYAEEPRWRPVPTGALEKNKTTLPVEPWFVVGGTVQAGTRGADGEPVLKDVVVISGLRWDENDGRFIETEAKESRKNHPGHGEVGGCTCTGR